MVENVHCLEYFSEYFSEYSNMLDRGFRRKIEVGGKREPRTQANGVLIEEAMLYYRN
jgi:hypothetical protein